MAYALDKRQACARTARLYARAARPGTTWPQRNPCSKNWREHCAHHQKKTEISGCSTNTPLAPLPIGHTVSSRLLTSRVDLTPVPSSNGSKWYYDRKHRYVDKWILRTSLRRISINLIASQACRENLGKCCAGNGQIEMPPCRFRPKRFSLAYARNRDEQNT